MSHVAIIATSDMSSPHPDSVAQLAWQRTYPHAQHATGMQSAGSQTSAAAIVTERSETGSDLSAVTTSPAELGVPWMCPQMLGEQPYVAANMQPFAAASPYPMQMSFAYPPHMDGFVQQGPYLAPLPQGAGMFYAPPMLPPHGWPAVKGPHLGPQGQYYPVPPGAHQQPHTPPGRAPPPPPGSTAGGAATAVRPQGEPLPHERSKAAAEIQQTTPSAPSKESAPNGVPKVSLLSPAEPLHVQRNTPALVVETESLQHAKDASDEPEQYAPSPVVTSLQKEVVDTPAEVPVPSSSASHSSSAVKENTGPATRMAVPQARQAKSCTAQSGPPLDIAALALSAQACAAVAQQAAAARKAPGNRRGAVAKEGGAHRMAVLSPLNV